MHCSTANLVHKLESFNAAIPRPADFSIDRPLIRNAQVRIQLPRTGFTAGDLAVIINDADPLSRQIGNYYRKARNIPAANVIHLDFPPGRDTLSKDEFQQLKAKLDRKTPAHIQAYAVAWTVPFRVDCMSLNFRIGFRFRRELLLIRMRPDQAQPLLQFFQFQSRQRLPLETCNDARWHQF